MKDHLNIHEKFTDSNNTEWFTVNGTSPTPYIFYVNKLNNKLFYTVRVFLVNIPKNDQPFCIINLETHGHPKQILTASTPLNFDDINNKISDLIQQIAVTDTNQTTLDKLIATMKT